MSYPKTSTGTLSRVISALCGSRFQLNAIYVWLALRDASLRRRDAFILHKALDLFDPGWLNLFKNYMSHVQYCFLYVWENKCRQTYQDLQVKTNQVANFSCLFIVFVTYRTERKC